MPDDSIKITIYYKIALSARKSSRKEMFLYAEKALALAKKIGINTEIAKSYHILGIFYAETGDLQNALEYFFKSLHVLEELGDEGRKGVALGAIARVSQMLENYDDALKYDLQALDIALRNKDTLNLATNYNNVGADYNNLKNFEEATEYYNKALQISRKNNNFRIQALSHLNIGFAFQKIKKYDDAYINLRQSEQIYHKIKDKNGQVNCLNKLAAYYQELNQADSAIINARKALFVAEGNGAITQKRQSYAILNEAYKHISKFDSAYKYMEMFNILNDSIRNSGNTKKITQLEMQYRFEKEREIDSLKHKAEVEKQESLTILFLVAFFLAVVLVIFIFRSFIIKKKSETKLLELNAVKDKFFKIISHDLKSPFTAFISISEILSNPEIKLSPEKTQYFANSINTSAKSSYDLFQNLLMWSMSQRCNLEINKTEIKVHTILTDTISLLTASADAKKIEITHDILPELAIITDKNIFKTVLRNLISNSIKFTPEGGKIQIFSKPDNHYLHITVSDNGIGISAENLTKIFKTSSHHTTPGTNSEPGTGLGLILCQEILEKAGGNISVESEESKGSGFTISLPL